MAISERDRHEMHAAPRQAIGQSEADTLMEHLPPVGWADVATKRDLDALRAATRGDLDALRATTRGDLAELRGDVRTEMARGFRRVVMWMATLVVGGLIAGMGVAATIGRGFP